MSEAIVLAVDGAKKKAIWSSSAVTLTGSSSDIVAILRAPEVFVHNKEKRVARTLG